MDIHVTNKTSKPLKVVNVVEVKKLFGKYEPIGLFRCLFGERHKVKNVVLCCQVIID